MDGSLQKQDGVLSVLVTHIEAAPSLPSEHPVFVPSPREAVREGVAPSLPAEDVFPDSRNYR
jgi:hypothetical protein